jgi:hypothetical protein
MGIDKSNQELTKESAFGAMGVFIFLFVSSVIYLCLHKHRDEELVIRSQGYMRPQLQGGGARRNDYLVELPNSVHSTNNSYDEDEFESVPT